MGIILSALLLALGLAMDAFAVSMCKGLTVKKFKFSNAVTTGLYFGIFQAVMPTVGYLLGKSFKQYISAVDHFIAFALLVIIGANMIKEAYSKASEEYNDLFTFCAMFPLAIATSIDALVAGIGFIGADISIPLTIAAIGILTFLTSALGVRIGNIFGAKYKSKAEIVGGVVLIGMGLKFLLTEIF